MHLLSPLDIRDARLRNRIVVSPMCQYSCENGFATDWHLVHLGSRAVGGAGLVFTEATAVEARGRISPADLGIWSDEHIAPLGRIAAFVKAQGGVPGIQLAHAGRKGSTYAPWLHAGAVIPLGEGGWQAVAPSSIPFRDGDRAPSELTVSEIHSILDAFAAAARRSLSAGFEVIEIHAAHGYLLHEFLSPLSNLRSDAYGGSFDNRIRLLVDVIQAVRGGWPNTLPLFVRISASDWVEGGWAAADSVALAKRLKPLGVDLIDCSSGGLVPHAKIPVAPGYQVPFAAEVRREAGILTGAVGMITDPYQAEEIVKSGQADLVSLAREFLRDPYWPLHAESKLHAAPQPPIQYARAF